jgi:hypothetical protein
MCFSQPENGRAFISQVKTRLTRPPSPYWNQLKRRLQDTTKPCAAMTPLPPPAPLLTVPEIPVLAAPEAVAKTARSVTLRLRVDHLANPDKRFSFQLVATSCFLPSFLLLLPADEFTLWTAWCSCAQSHSEHGYVYYSWTESDLFPGKSCPIKGLMPATVRPALP